LIRELELAVRELEARANLAHPDSSRR
jgi:hypothetical protein